MKETSKDLDLESERQLEIFDEEESRDILVDDYEDLELELVKSTRRRFLTWNDFD